MTTEQTLARIITILTANPQGLPVELRTEWLGLVTTLRTTANAYSYDWDHDGWLIVLLGNQIFGYPPPECVLAPGISKPPTRERIHHV